jgi:hypothetical protein
MSHGKETTENTKIYYGKYPRRRDRNRKAYGRKIYRQI